MSDQDFVKIQEIRQDVQSRYPNITFPDVVLEPLWWGRRPENRAHGRFAIVDQNNDQVFNVCTDAYKPIYHEQVIKLAEDAAQALPEFGKAEVSIKVLANGGKLKVEVKFPEVDYEIKPGDVVNPKMDIMSSYDLGWKYSGMFGAYRLVCSNGLTVGKVFDKFKKRHLTSLDPGELSQTMLSGMSQFSEQTELWTKWADQQILPEMYEGMWEALPFSPTEREKMEALPEAATSLILPTALKSGELTRWGFYNVVTQFATHEIKSELRQVEVGPQITKVFESFKFN